jgi:hypothetical protein
VAGPEGELPLLEGPVREAPPGAADREGSRMGKLGLVLPELELDLARPAWLLPEPINDGPALCCAVVPAGEAWIV